MKSKSLEFYKQIEGKKKHFIFKQDDVFYVMTSMDEDKRGNFFSISQFEINKLLRYIQNLNLSLFHPDEIDLFKEIEKEYRTQRIRSICYILVGKDLLELEKYGREIYFRATNKILNKNVTSTNRVNDNLELKHIDSKISNQSEWRLILESHSDTKNDKENKSNKKRKTVTNCPFCGFPVRTDSLRTHKMKTCPKRIVK